MCDKQSYREMGYKPRKPEELPEEKKEKKRHSTGTEFQEQYIR